MNVEPKALVDCFTHSTAARPTRSVTSCYIDIGCVATRAVIARGGQILFARMIPVGGDHFNRGGRQALKISSTKRKLLRVQAVPAARRCDEQPREAGDRDAASPPQAPARSDREFSFALLRRGVVDRAAAQPRGGRQSPTHPRPPSPAAVTMAAHGRRRADSAQAAPGRAGLPRAAGRSWSKSSTCAAAITRRRSRTSRSTGWSSSAARRGSGGCASTIARELGLAAQVGDPLVRMGRISDDRNRERHRPPPAAARLGRRDRPEHGPGGRGGKCRRRSGTNEPKRRTRDADQRVDVRMNHGRSTQRTELPAGRLPRA